MNVLLRRLPNDKEVEGHIQDLIITCIKSQDIHIQVKISKIFFYTFHQYINFPSFFASYHYYISILVY